MENSDCCLEKQISLNIKEKTQSQCVEAFFLGDFSLACLLKGSASFFRGKSPSPPFPFWEQANLTHHLEKELEKIDTWHSALIKIEQVCIWWTSML